MSDQPDRALLEAKSRDDLVVMAGALGIEIAPRARKATIIDDLLKGPSVGQEAAEAEVSTRRVRRTAESDGADVVQTELANTPEGSSLNEDEVQKGGEGVTKSDNDSEDAGVGEPGNRRRRRRGRERDKDDNWQGDPVECE